MEKILQSIERLLMEIRNYIMRDPVDARVGIVRSVSLTATPIPILPEDGSIVGWFLSNSRTSAIYIKLYDRVNPPDVATSQPDMTIMLPASSAANVSFQRGIPFKNGIWAIAVTGYADTDTTSPSAGEVITNFFLEGN